MMTGLKNLQEKILQVLESSGVKFRLIDHERTVSAQDAAQVAGAKIEEVAKSLILVADKKPLLAVVMGNQRLDPKKLKKLRGIKDLRFANPEEVVAYSGCAIGSVPPFGNLFSVPVVVDNTLTMVGEVVFAAGSNRRSVRMKREDFLKILGGEVVDLKRE